MTAEDGPAGRVVAGRYALRSVLGRGGMGVVWLATDRVLERQVAVKEISFSLAHDEEERRVLRERTMREARAAARLVHPCVTAVYDVVEEHGKPWLVMEHVPAASLQELLESSGPLPPREAARIGLDVLAALEAAHAAGILHRDVKPANVLVGPDGHAHLTDFGIATTTGDSSLTTRGSFIGSPSYMAPERVSGEDPGPAADLWSLGATLYAAVEGRPPYDRGEPLATLTAVVTDHPAPALRAGALEPVLRGLLTKDPALRSRPADVRRQLEAVQASASVPAAPSPDPFPESSPGRARRAVEGEPMARFDAEQLRSIGAASRAVIGSVARDARDEARHLLEQRREKVRARTGADDGGRAAVRDPGRRPRRGRRIKRRWVVVPLLVVLLVVLLAIAGAAVLIAHVFGS
jgi:serine/threonine protein kinase